MLIDTHGHIQFNAYKDDSDAVIENAFKNGVAIIAPSSQIDTSIRSVEYAEKWNNDFLYSAVGLHPIHLEDIKVDESEVGDQTKFQTRQEEFDRERYEKLLSSKKVIAIGEVGLDYWRKPKSKTKRAEYIQKQKDALIQQLDLALEYNLPVILHCRVAFDDLIDILKNHKYVKEMGGQFMVSHSFTGTTEQLKEILDLGLYIGVNGLVFKLDLVKDAVKNAPLERIVLETDAPYLSPPNHPERNEPAFITETAKEIARIKNISYEEVEKTTTENAIKLFRLSISSDLKPQDVVK